MTTPPSSSTDLKAAEADNSTVESTLFVEHAERALSARSDFLEEQDTGDHSMPTKNNERNPDAFPNLQRPSGVCFQWDPFSSAESNIESSLFAEVPFPSQAPHTTSAERQAIVQNSTKSNKDASATRTTSLSPVNQVNDAPSGSRHLQDEEKAVFSTDSWNPFQDEKGGIQDDSQKNLSLSITCQVEDEYEIDSFPGFEQPPQFVVASRPETSQPGAIAVPGPLASRQSTETVRSEASQTVLQAHRVEESQDELAMENSRLRERLGNVVQAHVVDTKQWFATKRCEIVVFACLVFALAIIAGVLLGILLGSKNNGGPIVSPVPSSSPTFSPTLAPSFSGLASFVGDDVGDRFGVDVQISRDGKRLAVGANDRNYIKVYENKDDRWEQIGQKVRGARGSFGSHHALNGNGFVLVTGSWGNDVAGIGAGQAQVYHYVNDTWSPMGQNLYGDAGDRFGWDVDVSDNGLTIAVSARHGENSSNALEEEGYVRIYTYNASLLESGHWIQKGNNISGVYAKGEFGRSVALTSNGNRIAVGAHEAGSLGEGQITVYDFVDNEWTQVGKPLSGEAFEDWQGTSLAINANGTILVTSADGNDRAGNESGLVRAYRLVDGTWSQ